MRMTRREFVGTVAMAGCPILSEASAVDRNLSVFVSDLHIPALDIPLDDERDRSAPTASYDHFSRIVDRILAMRPLPAKVIVLGDLAYLRGRAADYRHSAPLLRRLSAAGIELVLGLGNHDHRKAFADVWPDQVAQSPVPGFVVRETSIGTCDLVLLDTLQENPDPESSNPGDGAVSAEQARWMETVLAKRTRPFVLCGHHPCSETALGDRRLYNFVMDVPRCCGYIHGHTHYWNRQPLYQWYGEHRVKREVTVPSTGFYGDIGYVVCRTDPGWVNLTLVQDDFYFRTYRPEGADRPEEWAEMVRENAGEYCRLRLH